MTSLLSGEPNSAPPAPTCWSEARLPRWWTKFTSSPSWAKYPRSLARNSPAQRESGAHDITNVTFSAAFAGIDRTAQTSATTPAHDTRIVRFIGPFLPAPRIPRGSSALGRHVGRGPVDQAALEQGRDLEEGDAAQGQDGHGDEEERRVELGRRCGDQVAEALVAAPVELADHGADQAQREGDLEAGEDVRKRGRDLDLPEDHEARGVEGLLQANCPAVGRAQP